MPFISVKTNVGINKEKEENMKCKIGEAIKVIGKSESWLMMNFEETQKMYFAGRGELPIAFIRVELFGKPDESLYNKLTRKITDIVTEELGIDPDKIYVKYDETDKWGWNGSNF